MKAKIQIMTDLHRVFGYNPINAEIIVACDGAGYHMAMACNV